MAAPNSMTDAKYLEAAARLMFMGGLNRAVVDAKWSGFRVAFHGFDIDSVASMGPDDVERLSRDKALIRNHAKLMAVVHNAEEIKSLAAAHGSFDAYVDELLASGGLAKACAELAVRFAFISKDGAKHWLYSTGHDVGDLSDKARAKYAPYEGQEPA